MTRCLVCDKPLTMVACFDGWCEGCAGQALSALLFLRDGPAEVIGARVAWYKDQGVPFLARVIVGCVPFEQTLQRLTYE
jgi:hypothetical protein